MTGEPLQTMKEDVPREVLETGRFLDSKKGEDIEILDLREVNSYLEFFVIATGNSRTHCRSMAREVMRHSHDLGVEPLHKPDLDSEWIVIDCGDLVIHVFTPEARSFYQLERLWGDAGRVSIP
jgi:ribosome-associated protein